MPIKTVKEVFVALLSDLRQGAERSQKIYEELGQAAQDREIKRLSTRVSSSPLKL